MSGGKLSFNLKATQTCLNNVQARKWWQISCGNNTPLSDLVLVKIRHPRRNQILSRMVKRTDNFLSLISDLSSVCVPRDWFPTEVSGQELQWKYNRPSWLEKTQGLLCCYEILLVWFSRYWILHTSSWPIELWELSQIRTVLITGKHWKNAIQFF